MSGREVPFDPKEKCDNCGKLGAFDFMGDYLCADCFDALNEEEPIDIIWEDDE